MKIEEEVLVLEANEDSDAFKRGDRTYVKVDSSLPGGLNTMEQGINYSAIFTEKLTGINKEQLDYRLNKDKDQNLWVSWNSDIKSERYGVPVSEIQDFIMENSEISVLLQKAIQEILSTGKVDGSDVCDLVGEAVESMKDKFQEVLDRKFL